MEIEIKNYKTFHGHDGYGWECSLYIDGKRTAIIVDDGYGGGLNWHPIGTRKSKQLQETGKRMFRFIEKCKAIGQVELSIGVESENSFHSFSTDMTWEIWLEENLLPLADIKHQVKSKILLEEDGKYFTLSGAKYTKANKSRILAHVAEKYPKATLINGNRIVTTLS